MITVIFNLWFCRSRLDYMIRSSCLFPLPLNRRDQTDTVYLFADINLPVTLFCSNVNSLYNR